MSKNRSAYFKAKHSMLWPLIGTFFFLLFPFGNYGERFDHQGASYKYPFNLSAAAHASVQDAVLLSRWPHEKSDLPPDPALIFGTLPNGFKYVLMQNHTPKDRVSMHLNIQAGSMNESDNQQGVAHFLEHMMFNGSEHFKPGELVKYFQNIGMRFGPDANAHTGFRETVYDLLLPDGSKESLQKGLRVMKDFANGALLLESEINRERRVVLAEKRTRDSVSYRTFVSTINFEFPETRISKRLPIGIKDVIEKADRSLLKDYYDTWYRPETTILVMVGDFDAPLAASLIKESFSTFNVSRPAKDPPDIGEINHQGIKTFYHFEKEAGKTTISIEVVRKVSRQPDSFDAQRKMLLNEISDRIVQNRLDALVRQPDPFFTSASIGSDFFLREVEYAAITAACSSENWEKALAAIEQTLRGAIAYVFTPSELERVKKDFLADLDNAVKKAPTRDSQDLSREIISNLNADRVFQSPEQRKELFAPLINSLTLKTVEDAFKETWSPEHRLVIVTGNAKLTDPGASPEGLILSTFNKSSQTLVAGPVDQKAVTFPYLSDPAKKGRIVNKSNISDLGIVQVDFENGVRLNLKKTDFEADEVLVNLSFGSGRSDEPKDSPGLAALTEEVINETGLGALEKDEIERALAGKNTQVVFSVGEERFFFKGKTVSKQVPLLFQLLYAHIVDPAYRKDAYTLSMERFRQKYLSLSRSIDGAMKLSGERFLAGGDSRFGLPPYSEFKGLSLEHVQSWIDPPLRHDQLEVSVTGDFNEDSVVEIAAKYLGSLPRRNSLPVNKRTHQPVFPVSQSLAITAETQIPKGLVIVAYPTEDFWDIHRTRRVSVLADIFSDRLRERIREKLGASYSPFAYNRPSRAYPGYGVFQAFIHVAPKESDTVVAEVKKITSDLAENGITIDELERALVPMLTSIKDMIRTNSYWLNSVLTGSWKHSQQLDWSRTIMKDYAAVSVQEVSILAKKYLDNNKAATIIIQPAPQQ